MDLKQRKIIAREKWVKTYLKLGSVTKAAIRCGISRPTLYRWIKRYKIDKVIGLSDKSQRPKNLTNSKVDDDLESIILKTRKRYNCGPQRIPNYLLRTRRIQLSPMTIWRVISRNQCAPVLKKRKKSDFKRYSKSIPGERVQIDVTKIRSKAYQFTAIDDCTRLKLIRIYENKKRDKTIHFLGELLDNFPFPIQRIQTDWGTEFFNYDFPYELHEHFIKFRPIKPQSPHLNGKVERTQQTDKVEFWQHIDLDQPNEVISNLALQWQDFYNNKRPHSSLSGKTPLQK
jgi:transposase InsO family protein